jgi:hypothetical protein
VPQWLESAPWRAIGVTHRYGAFRPRRLAFVPVGEIRRMLLVPGREGPAAPADRPLVTVEASLQEDVGVNGLLKTPPWGIEPPPGALVWLGHGPEQAFGAMLWSAKERHVTVRCDVLAGPARPAPGRTVELTLRAGDRVARETRVFEREAALSFTGRLTPGRNHLTLTVLDPPTVSPRPGGDPRSLMLLLRRMSITAIDDRAAGASTGGGSGR